MEEEGEEEGVEEEEGEESQVNGDGPLERGRGTCV